MIEGSDFAVNATSIAPRGLLMIRKINSVGDYSIQLFYLSSKVVTLGFNSDKDQRDAAYETILNVCREYDE